MIRFATLLLGLVLGPQPIELLVADGVASVELFVDQRVCARIEGPPWLAICDLGPRLEPSRLIAVGRDVSGAEVGRAEQALNVWREPAELSVLLERDAATGARQARVAAASLALGKPRALAIALDGAPLASLDAARFEVPPVDETMPHLLRVEAEWSDTVAATAEIVFGGSYGSQLAAEMTALPIFSREPDAALSGLLRAALATPAGVAEIAAIEHGAAEVWVVADPAELSKLARWTRADTPSMPGFSSLPGVRDPRGRDRMGGRDWRFRHPLASGDRLRIVWPWPERKSSGGEAVELFRPSAALRSDEGGLPWLLAAARLPTPGEGKPRLADAVAVSALTLLGQERRRAIVLLLGRGDDDGSRLQPEQVSPYLTALRIPLHVWRTERWRGAGEEPWGSARRIDSPQRLAQAIGDLIEALAGQRIVWVHGAYLPDELALRVADSRLQLAGVP